MAKAVRVLIVEDSPDDAELEILQLKQEGFEPEWTRVETAAEFNAALCDGYEVILADYRLPHFSGLEALDLLRKSGRPIPLILISGTVGEELAIECMKQGATDYLLKDRLARLGSAVQHALDQRAARQARLDAEEALRRGEAYYRAIVELPVAQIVRWRPDLTLTFANAAFAHTRGKEPEELIGTNWVDLLPEPDREEFRSELAALVADPHISTVEYSMRDAQGNLLRVLWTDYPIVDSEGRVTEFQSFGLEVTELRSAELQVHLLSRAVEQSPLSIIVTDRNGVIQYANPRTAEMTGYSIEELIGKTPGMLKSGSTPPEIYRGLWQTILAGREWHGEMQNRKKSGELYWEAQKISPILNAQGEITHFVAIQEDITQRKAMDAALRALNEQLEQHVEERTAELRTMNAALQRAALAKDEFLASMSHELRTPLAGILGVLEGMQEQIYGVVTDRQRNALQAMRASGEHLLGLINDILDVAKAEAGQLKPQVETVSVGDICQASINLIRGMAQKKHLRISLSLDPASISLEADGRRVKQILVNLLSNAVKFTPEEGQIGLQAEGDAEQQVVRLSVWDTGIGIAEKDLGKLFQPFTQLDSSLAREYAGTGLGLALVRSLAEMHGGSVEVTSTLGQGSRFVVTLPWSRAQAPSARGVMAASGDGAAGASAAQPSIANLQHPEPLILLADDNDLMIEVYKSYLEAAGCRVLVAQRGSEAVQIAERQKPDVILMDIQMPGMDGLAAIRLIRASADAQVAATPIVALTALAMPGDRERCLAAGADEYLSKPVALNKLVSAISRLLAG